MAMPSESTSSREGKGAGAVIDPSKYDEIWVKLKEHPGPDGEPQYWKVALPHHAGEPLKNLHIGEILSTYEDDYRFISLALSVTAAMKMQQPHTIPALLYCLDLTDLRAHSLLRMVQGFARVRPYLLELIRKLRDEGFEMPLTYETGYE